jgi:hypothetical protein
MGELLEEWHLTPPPENTTTVTSDDWPSKNYRRRLAIIRQKNPRIDWFLLVLPVVVQLNEDYHELPYVYM